MSGIGNTVFLANNGDQDLVEQVGGVSHWLPAGCKRGPVRRSEGTPYPIPDPDAKVFARRHPKIVVPLWDTATNEVREGVWICQKRNITTEWFQYGGVADKLDPFERKSFPPEIASHAVQTGKFAYCPSPSDANAYEVSLDMDRQDLKDVAKYWGVDSRLPHPDIVRKVNAAYWVSGKRLKRDDMLQHIAEVRGGRNAKESSS